MTEDRVMHLLNEAKFLLVEEQRKHPTRKNECALNFVDGALLMLSECEISQPKHCSDTCKSVTI